MLALGEMFPSKTVKITTPFSADATSLTFTRVVADKLSKMGPRPMIIDAWGPVRVASSPSRE